MIIIAVFLLVIFISRSAMDSVFDKVFALQIASSSSSLPILASESELSAINSANPPPTNHFSLHTGYRIEPVILHCLVALHLTTKTICT